MSQVRKSIFSSVSMSVIIVLLGLFTGVAAARILGPAERGYLGIIVFWTQLLANAFRLPFSEGLLVYCRHAERQDRTTLARSVSRIAEKIAKIMAVSAFPVAAMILLIVTAQQELPHLELVLVLLALTLFSRTQNEVFMGLLYIDQRFDLINVARVIVPATYAAGVLIVAVVGYGMEGFLVAQCASLITVFIFRYFYYPRNLDIVHSPVDKVGILRVAASLQGLTLVTLITKQIDKLLIFSFAPTVFVGHYIVAFTLLTPTQAIINTALSNIGLPAFAGLAPDRRVAAARKMLRAASSASALSTAAVALVAVPIVPIIFGTTFKEAAWMTVALSGAIALQPLRTAAGQILKTLGKIRTILASEVMYAANFSIIYFALSEFDLLSRVAVSFLLANMASLAVLTFALSTNLPGLRARDWIWPTPQSIREIIILVIPAR